MRFVRTAVLLAIVCFASTSVDVASAHKSVRHRKPETEEERERHHLHHRRMPSEASGDSVHHHAPAQHRSPLYHHRFGPSYPEHHENHNSHFIRPRFNAKGDSVPDIVEHKHINRDHDDHAHLQNRERHQ
jgi:hypothetical protein